METYWEEAYGPLYPVQEAAHIICVSAEVLNELATRNEALRFEDGRFPGWQFDLCQLAVFPAVVEIIRIFYERELDALDVASFCVFPSDEIDENCLLLPLDLFEEGQSPRLMKAARRTAARLSD